MKDGTHLTGLEGTNPLGFLAALGVQVLFEQEKHQPKLWWSKDIIPHAIVDTEFDLDRIIEQAFQTFALWLKSPALNPGFGNKADDSGKFKPDELREYIKKNLSDHAGNRLASALVAEGSLDGAGKVAKPSDLYFMAGQLKFLQIARELLENVDRKLLIEGLAGPWSYSSKLSSLGWDITDDRNYAIAAANPAKEKKLTNPGAEALAILGLSRHPVFGNRDQTRTLTLGCAGPWRRNGTYTWPLWTRPATPRMVRSILAHTTGEDDTISKRSHWYIGWGISLVMRSVIRRSDQGGYGTFSPPEIAWSRG